MKTVVLILFLLSSVFSNYLLGQNTMEYNHGIGNIYRYLKYPQTDKEQGNDGLVIIKFKTDGKKIDSVIVLNSISNTIDKEAIRVFMLTQNKWNLVPNEYYLFSFRFLLDYLGKEELSQLKKKRDKAFKKQKNYNKLIEYCKLIKKQEPFDFQNLDILISTYENSGHLDLKQKTIALKKDLENLKLIVLKY